jgi:hypothetical protein
VGLASCLSLSKTNQGWQNQLKLGDGAELFVGGLSFCWLFVFRKYSYGVPDPYMNGCKCTLSRPPFGGFSDPPVSLWITSVCVCLCANGSAELYPNNMYPNNSAELYPNNNTELYPNSNADLYPNNNAELHPNNNAELHPDNNAELHPNNNAQQIERSLSAICSIFTPSPACLLWSISHLLHFHFHSRVSF